MHCLNVILTVKDPADVPKVRELLTECGRLSRQESGCDSYEVCHSTSDPQVFMLCERWATEADWQEPRRPPANRETYQPPAIQLAGRVAHPSDLLE